jgi:hypothetical protein
MTLHPRYPTGRRPADPQRVAAVKPHVYAATAPAPLVLPRMGLWKTPPALVRNDVLPTCCIAGLINSARVWALLRGFDLAYDENDLLGDYATLAGCEPTEAAIAATDGLQMIDVLEHFQVKGLDIGAQAPLVLDFARVDLNAAALRDVVASRGSVYVGTTLYQADMQPGAKWRGKPLTGDTVAGLHCQLPFAFPMPDSFDDATWGEIESADDDWLLSRLDEAYSLFWSMAVAEAA